MYEDPPGVFPPLPRRDLPAAVVTPTPPMQVAPNTHPSVSPTLSGRPEVIVACVGGRPAAVFRSWAAFRAFYADVGAPETFVVEEVL